jgi:hypothetical protein
MNLRSRVQSGATWLLGGLGVAAPVYGVYAGVTWIRYGHAATPRPEERDPLLDRFMPTYEVAERHHVRVAAPAALTLAAAKDVDLQGSGLVRTIIKARELILGATPVNRPRPLGLLAETQSLGWGALAEVPDRELVVGAVTRPWEANVTFRAIPPDQFAAFNEPGYVKRLKVAHADDPRHPRRTRTRDARR